MKMTDIFNKVTRQLSLCGLLAVSLASCNSMIYDEQGDCDPHYKVKFEYRYHLGGNGDNFASEVKAVTLYLIDESGHIVWQKSESGDKLASDHYLMDVDVAPGQYTLLAWCGEGVGSHFTVNNSADLHTDLHCRLDGQRDDNGAHFSSDMLNHLFHGRLDTQVFPDDEGTYVYTVQLVKDTNDINIILQQLSGEPIDASMFEFEITDNNSWLDWTNTPFADNEQTSYRPHAVTSLVADVPDYTDGFAHSQGAIRAEHTTSRLMTPTSTSGQMYLKIRRVSGAPEVTHAPMLAPSPDDNIVVNAPLTDYCLRFKTERYKDMEDQEFLDRCDTYNMVFFLDEGYRWMDAFIYINSFKVVKQNADI